MQRLWTCWRHGGSEISVAPGRVNLLAPSRTRSRFRDNRKMHSSDRDIFRSVDRHYYSRASDIGSTWTDRLAMRARTRPLAKFGQCNLEAELTLRVRFAGATGSRIGRSSAEPYRAGGENSPARTQNTARPANPYASTVDGAIEGRPELFAKRDDLQGAMVNTTTVAPGLRGSGSPSAHRTADRPISGVFPPHICDGYLTTGLARPLTH